MTITDPPEIKPDLRRQRLENDLARARAEVDQLIASVSHDLRSPLLAISGCAQLLGEQFGDALTGEGAELIGMIQDGVARMGLIIKGLLAFARATPAEDAFRTVDCAQVLDGTLAQLGGLMEQTGASVTHGSLPQVTGSPTQLGQVFTRLIENAIKFHGADPPRVHVRAAEHRAEWEFSIRDNGIGIEPVHFERIFGIFERLAGDDRHDGAGIGLPICKKIVEHHHGRIWLESQPGQGSTFLFTIPKSQ